MSTKSANRPPRDKHNKSAATDKTKSDVISSNKIQPTAEQMQMARIMNNDSNKGEDPEVTAKIRQVQELTGASEDDALFALYDFNYDLDRAVEKLLESSDTQNEWHTISKKEKSQPAPKPEPVVNSKPDLRREKSKDRDYIPERNDSSGPRNRRERGPPRFQRGRGRERPVMEEDRNMADFAGGERNFDRSERGGRGRGRGGGPGRGRGRGRNNPNFRGTRFDTNRDKGPHIDTWTNEQAETNADKENIGSWGDMAEDWTSEDWQGNLDEPKIFTASSNTPSTDIFSPSMNDNDAKMFSPPVSIETQVFTSATIPVSAVSPTLNDTTNTFQHGNSPLPQAAMSTGTIGHNSISQQPALGQSPNLGPRLDISTFFNTGETSSPPSQQNQFMSRFAKEATESIKNAVGIGNAAAGQQAPVGLPPANVNDVSRSMAPPSGQSSSPVIGNAASQRATAAKVQRTKLPPPSKIPASAVEMPGSMNSFNLDVQFGNWDLGSDSGSSSLGFGSVISTGVSVSSNYASSAPTIAPTQPQVTSMLDGLTPSETSPHNAGPVYQNPVNTTPPKDYSQSSIKSTTISTPPDPIPFPSPKKKKVPTATLR